MSTHALTPADRDHIAAARALLDPCRACARGCDARRLHGEPGFCKITDHMHVASAGPHFGEEPPLVGTRGSGTIFLGGCNLDCVFCQNWDISHPGTRRGRPDQVPGEAVTPIEMTELMLRMASAGCHNVNFVTPSHVGPLLLESIIRARRRGLDVPIVWNCGGYESMEMLRLLDGWVEIYMPDVKYADDAVAQRLSHAPGYVPAVRAALKEMHRQVGDLEIAGGVAVRGLVVRHLVLPNDLAGSKATIDFLADEISPHTYLNVMAQYRPEYRAHEHPGISRPPTHAEFDEAHAYAASRALRLAR